MDSQIAEVTFGPFSLEVPSARLLRDGTEVKLRPRAFHALRVLLRHQGRPLGYEQMIAEAWEGTFVSRHTVDVTVAEVKKSLGEYGRWIVHRPKAGYCLEVPSSDELVRKGWHFLNRRTRDAADRAIDCFQQAVAECAGDFRAFEGLSTSYLMLATFGMRSPRNVYKDFLESHNRAVASGGLRPELRCNRAHGLHMFERRPVESEEEFLQTIREKPNFGTAYVRAALLYSTLGRLDDAQQMLDRCSQVDPLLPTLPASLVLVKIFRRDFDTAIALGRKAIELHPYLQISRANFGQALEFAGRLEEALAEYQVGSVVSPDLPWMRAMEATCLAKMGRTREALAILEGLDELRRAQYVDALYLAVLRETLGQRDEAFIELQRACEENSAFLYSIDVDPKMDAFRPDPRFGRLRDALFA